MTDFQFVTERIATGAALSGPEDVQAMVDAGITHVIDCRAEFDDTQLFAENPSISVLWNGVPDDGIPKPPEWFQKSIDFALLALTKPHAKVYAHCHAGINRGPSACYAIIRSLGISPADAEAIIRKVRPQVGLAYKNDADKAVESLYL